jgi:hypothetical protein
MAHVSEKYTFAKDDENRNEKHQTHRDIRRHDALNRTKIQKILGRLKAVLMKSAALILRIF